jgi:putative transcriptional regulator
MNTEKISRGQLLIAEPSIIGDISFHRAIILLADYNDHGAVGFIMNKPLNYTINDLIPKIYAEFQVYNGGPVEQDNLYFIHNIPQLIPKSIAISDGIYWGGDFETTIQLINNNQISKENIRFFLGYTGWSANQLENEMRLKSWFLTHNNYVDKIIEKSSQNFWKEKLSEIGGEYLIWSNAPENPLSN